MHTRLVSAVRQFRCALQATLIAATAIGAAIQGVEAQQTETPVPFDAAGTVRSITPPLVARLGLAAPTWPVRDDFVEARLYAIGNDAYVIVVERKDGRRDRYALTGTEAAALRAEVTSTVERVGRVVGEESANDISEPARGAFVRNQMLLSAAMYAPALSALTHDATVGGALYLLSIGGSYFIVSGISKSTTVTKAQNAQATDAALRLPAALFGTYYALGVESLSQDLASSTLLLGGIGGSMLGYHLGRGLTPGEAASMRFGSTLSALTAIGVTGTVGLIDNGDDAARVATGIAVAAGVAGYAVGAAYPRHAPYTVTNGDVGMLGISGLLGAMTAAIPVVGMGDPDVHLVSGLLTAGMLGGVLIGDRVFVRPWDHTDGEAGLVTLGAVAGGLMGAALPVLAQSDDATFVLSAVTVGAVLGTAAAQTLVNPRRASSRRPTSTGASRLQFDPGALAFAAARRPGVYPVLKFTF